MFENYWLSKGDVKLTQSRFKDIVSTAGRVQYKSNITLSNGKQGVAKIHSFYGTKYGTVLGSATIYYDQNGTPVGFHDTYDFNWRWIWGKGSRSLLTK